MPTNCLGIWSLQRNPEIKRLKNWWKSWENTKIQRHRKSCNAVSSAVLFASRVSPFLHT
ncbi:hypothetical protein HOLleu_06782 [Holothuria leucospilota]|uniref:Uncharacterized protein n=1 Tax=Holothuria leucospilota TaxID=206669 RepID=A0A9Q1CNL5_HOLLE|nr:hypothetical protein HOLleu_06782 [Holothuria leucospilota]